VPLLARLLVITFVQSFATTLIERGLYFFSHDRLLFSDAQNLGLALGFGAAYAVGAVTSQRISSRLSEKRLLVLAILGQMLTQAALVAWPAPVTVAALNTLLGGLMGLMWPVVESYVSAGRTPADQAATVGRFNLSWAGAVPLGLVAAGPIIRLWAPSLFAAAALLNLLSLVLVLPLERRPVHLAPDHPERPMLTAMLRYRGLLASSRWLMMSSYSLMWTLAALLPHAFAKLQVDVQAATALSGLLDVFRMMAFLVLQIYVGWHNRGSPLVAAMFILPAGFFLALYGPTVPAVLAGELLFGLAAGTVYYAALYYAMVVKNAAVEAGGAHEGIIGSGFVIGLLAGLVGDSLAAPLGGALAGMAAGMGPVILACTVGAAWFLIRIRRQSSGCSMPPGL
jgi:MFS family permease